MAKKWPKPKDPNDVADYVINWAEDDDGNPGLAAGDPLSSSTWIVPDGITKDSDTFDDETTTIWLSGGTAGETYSLINRVTTSGGRTFDQTGKLKMKER